MKLKKKNWTESWASTCTRTWSGFEPTTLWLSRPFQVMDSSKFYSFENKNCCQITCINIAEIVKLCLFQVNEAEVERLESELEHQQTAAFYNELEQHSKHLQKKLKSSISKSKWGNWFIFILGKGHPGEVGAVHKTLE
jgi:hypothetical protein